MGERTTVSARRFETYVRWSTYAMATTPVVSVLGGMRGADWGVVTGEPPVLVVIVVLVLVLTAGNLLVSRWGLDLLVGRPRRIRAVVVVPWLLALVALVAMAVLGPALGTRTAAVVVGSAAASFATALDVRRALYLNLAAAVVAAPFAAVAGVRLVAIGVAVISLYVWACWAGTWVLRILLEVQQAHDDRAALALANERLRISRELHDVLGRTLTTIAVKSELASELVRRGDDERAAEEIAGVRRLAGEASTEVRHVVRGEVRVTWDGEVSGARSLLGSAGIRAIVTGDPVPGESAEALAWVVREGVTNVLRHSAATQVTLATTTEDGQVVLTLANDGAGHSGPAPHAAPDGTSAGTGLLAMSERIRALGGRVVTRRDGDWFLLEATLPLLERDRA